MKLVSFLGTTAYGETLYRWKDQEIRTAYSAAACCAFLHPEELIVFATEEAFGKNWEGLCDAVSRIGGPLPVRRRIALGKNEAELWQIFSDLTEEIPSGTEIAIDLTNGQRSLPAVVILASVFMKTGLNVNVSHLFYGAYKVDPETPDCSPMFDLSSMLELTDWGIAAERFSRAGDASELAKQFLDFGKDYAKNHEGADRQTGHMLRRLSEDLTEISRCYMLLRPKHIRHAEQRLKINLKNAETSLNNISEQKPLQLLLDRLEKAYIPDEELYDSEGEEMLIRERSMIRWYRERGHLMQAVSLAREWLLTWFMVRNGVVKNELLDDNHLRDEYNDKLICARDEQHLPENVDREGFFTLYDTLGDLRNDLMHAGKRPNPAKPKNLSETVNEQIDLLMQLPIGEEKK